MSTEPSDPERASRRGATAVVFLAVLAIGAAAVIQSTPDDGYAGEWVYLVPVIMAAGMARAVWVRGAKAVLLVLATVLLTLGLSCAAALENMEW